MFSVVVCTYNGAKYIREQIGSILGQTMPVDEIVICDDGSTDDTLGIVESAGKDCNCQFRVFQNEVQLGFKANFFSAIDRCNGDLIFLADQDDVWHPDKVKTVVGWFESHPDKNVVFSDASLIDEKGVAKEGSLWQRFGFDKKKQRFFDHGCALDIWMWSNRATGATIAVRKHFVDTTSWRKLADGYHDSIIAWQGVVSRSIGYIPMKLMDYRLHGEQVCGAEDLPAELYYSPLRPCPHIRVGGDINFFPEKEQKQVDFIVKRASFKNVWFGWGTISHLALYVKTYRGWAFKFFVYDLYISVRHSLKRVKNGCLRRNCCV